VSSSPVEIARKSACHRAMQGTIARQFRAQYDVSQTLPNDLLVLLQRFHENEQALHGIAACPVRTTAISGVIANAREKRAHLACLRSHLSITTAALEQAIEAARETLDRSRRFRDMRQAQFNSAAAC
jgi:hypothetical protein